MNNSSDDFFSLKEHIRKPTQYRNPTENMNDDFFSDDNNDFFHESANTTGDHPEQPPEKPNSEVDPIKPKPDPEISTQGALSLFDGLQHMGFFTAYQRKFQNRIFKSDDEFWESQDLAYLPDDSKKELSDEQKKLIAKNQDYIKKLEGIVDKLPLKEDEKLKMKGPLKEVIKHYNYDLPPGLTLAIVAGEILFTRVIEYRMQ